MSSSAADSSEVSFDTSSNAYSRSREVMAERDLYPLLREVIGVAVYINVAWASIVPTPLLKHREYGFIGWADHLTLVNTNRSVTFENARSSEMGRCVVSLWDRYNIDHFPFSG